MAPARTLTRRGQAAQSQVPSEPAIQESNVTTANEELFLEPMMGTPLAVYIEKDVADRELLVDLVAKHGGVIAPGYSGVPYVLVDPHKESGQNLYRQFARKKGKIVLNVRWIHECVKAGALQTFHNNWAGCKVTGQETVGQVDAAPNPSTSSSAQRRQNELNQVPSHIQTSHNMHSISHPMPHHAVPSVDPLAPPQTFPYPVYPASLHAAPRDIMHPGPAAPPPTWHTANGGIVPQQTHLAPSPHIDPRAGHPFRDQHWHPGYEPAVHPPGTIVAGGYEYRYREDHASWAGPNEFYTTQYGQTYEQPSFVGEAPAASTSAVATAVSENPRGRKRTRVQATPAVPASTLVLNRQNPPARSPTPPTRVIKSTYGGNLFTSDDVLYLKKYIDYCQEQGLVLSLREICERIAIKAPHHTFYSWRRYCNKHQLRLGGYTMNAARSPSPPEAMEQDDEADDHLQTGPGASVAEQAPPRAQDSGAQTRTRSPTPPRALFRSTTGKGVAFTDEDVTFLVRFMEYRKSQGRFDMVAFWKDVAAKAPHHSRASWMKFWRRHKHELNRSESDDPLPQPPEKKMRYSRDDDILLAKYFHEKPEGTSDKIFQAFGRIHPHHPWKGWQEHHRIHKAKIDHFIQQIASGESLEKCTDASVSKPVTRRSPAMFQILSQQQIDQFHRDGYLRIPAFLSADETDALLTRAKQLLHNFSLEDHPLTKFTTSDKDHVGDDYFLNSGDKIRYFLEEDAVDAVGNLNREKDKAVNKIGHGTVRIKTVALHELDPVFRKATLGNERLKSLVRDLKFHHDPVALQSMVITKQPQIGGEVPEHNDSTFLYTKPPTALGFWIALENCTPQNGALSFLPGSHLTSPITKRFVRLPRGGTGFEQLLPENAVEADSAGKYILEACAPGDLVIIHGSVLHKSERNTSPHTRFAYTFHMIDSPPHALYDQKNWLQPTAAMPFSRVLGENQSSY